MDQHGIPNEGARRSLEDILREVEQDDTLRTSEKDSTRETPSEVTGEGGNESGLGSLLSHPELLTKLPLLLRVVQSLGEKDLKLDDRRPDTPEQLLCALRPYLGQERRQAIDTMIRVSRLSASLKSLK